MIAPDTDSIQTRNRQMSSIYDVNLSNGDLKCTIKRITEVVDSTYRSLVTSHRRLYLPSVIRIEGYSFRICQRLNHQQSSFCRPAGPQFADTLFLEEISHTCSGAISAVQILNVFVQIVRQALITSADSQRLRADCSSSINH